MAIHCTIAGMSLPEKKSFYTLLGNLDRNSQASAKSVPQPNQENDAPPSSRESNSTGNTITMKPVQKQQMDTSGVSSVIAPTKPPTIVTVDVDVVPRRENPKKRTEEEALQSPSLDADPNHDRRKRRKSEDDGSSQNSTLDATQQVTDVLNPKRMLKLSGKGTFGSPNSSPRSNRNKPLTENPRPRGRPRRARSTKIVSLKYRRTDSTWVEVGQRIDRILAGSERLAQMTVPGRPASEPKKIEPPKSTHPFFLGKIKPMPILKDTPVTSETENESAEKPKSPKRLSSNSTRNSTPSIGIFGVFDQTPRIKQAGLKEAPWPWKHTSHVRGLPIADVASVDRSASLMVSDGFVKNKTTAVSIQQDEDVVLLSLAALEIGSLRRSDHGQSARRIHLDPLSAVPTTIRIPQRSVLTGSKIQELVLERLSNGPKLSKHLASSSENSPVQNHQTPHPALITRYIDIGNYLTPFDMSRCETQPWSQKYAPTQADHVLQPGRESIVLREWLRCLMIGVIDTGKHRPNTTANRSTDKSKKKKKRKADDLDDFIVSSDEEGTDLGDFTDLEDEYQGTKREKTNRSAVRRGWESSAEKGAGKQMASAILLTGPSGCGKTAAVYAVAKELGYEIFEINPGSRRSGKDVLDKIGDMTENHLVQRVSQAISDSTLSTEEKLALPKLDHADGQNNRQGSMSTFFRPVDNQPKQAAQKPQHDDKLGLSNSVKPSRPNQKQSLILFEEVDVLFEEDRQFWVTVLALASHSRRPVIMTCNDESLFKLDDSLLHAVLRFVPPPTDLAVDHLLLIAAREGHLLGREALEKLYLSKDHDLRATITELNFWCQVGVGTTKGGLDWMIPRYPPGADVDEYGSTLRVASNHTYLPGMGWSGRDVLSAKQNSVNRDEALLVELMRDWKITSTDLIESLESELPDGQSGCCLDDFAFFSDILSAADVCCGHGLRSGYQQLTNPGHPLPSDKTLRNYVEGYRLLPADPYPNFTNQDEKISATIFTLGQQFLRGRVSNESLHRRPTLMDERSLMRLIIDKKMSEQSWTPLSRKNFSEVFDSIAECKGPSTTPTASLTASCFDREFRIITEEVAPYVRAIAEHDLELEADKQRMLLSTDGPNPQRLRTSRVSRSALEGGRREEKRRERWFTKDLNLKLVMDTGGEAWSELIKKPVRTDPPPSSPALSNERENYET